MTCGKVATILPVLSSAYSNSFPPLGRLSAECTRMAKSLSPISGSTKAVVLFLDSLFTQLYDYRSPWPRGLHFLFRDFLAFKTCKSAVKFMYSGQNFWHLAMENFTQYCAVFIHTNPTLFPPVPSPVITQRLAIFSSLSRSNI